MSQIYYDFNPDKVLIISTHLFIQKSASIRFIRVISVLYRHKLDMISASTFETTQ